MLLKSNNFFYERGDDGSVLSFVTKDVDDFIIVGSCYMIQTFLHQFNYRFKFGNVRRNENFKILRYITSRDNSRGVSLSMPKYLEEMTTLEISKSEEETRLKVQRNRKQKLTKAL